MTPEERAAQAAARSESVQALDDDATDIVGSVFGDDPNLPLSQQGGALTAEEKRVAEEVDRKNGLMGTEDEEWAAYLKSTGDDEPEADIEQPGDSTPAGDVAADGEGQETGLSLDVARALVALAEARVPEAALEGQERYPACLSGLPLLGCAGGPVPPRQDVRAVWPA